MAERTLEEMVADVDAAMRLTKTELGRALTRKEEAKRQAAACRVKIDELEERMEELKIRDQVAGRQLAELLARTPIASVEQLAELDRTDPILTASVSNDVPQ
jgi:phage shock protein A